MVVHLNFLSQGALNDVVASFEVHMPLPFRLLGFHGRNVLAWLRAFIGSASFRILVYAMFTSPTLAYGTSVTGSVLLLRSKYLLQCIAFLDDVLSAELFCCPVFDCHCAHLTSVSFTSSEICSYSPPASTMDFVQEIAHLMSLALLILVVIMHTNINFCFLEDSFFEDEDKDSVQVVRNVAGEGSSLLENATISTKLYCFGHQTTNFC